MEISKCEKWSYLILQSTECHLILLTSVKVPANTAGTLEERVVGALHEDNSYLQSLFSILHLAANRNSEVS